MNVYITTRTVGDYFGTVGQVRRIGSRRLLAESDVVVPYGYNHAAAQDAERLARQRGWTVVDVEP